jgi:hypothetical protein
MNPPQDARPDNGSAIRTVTKNFDLSKITPKNSDNVHSVYANSVQIIPTNWDFRFLLSEITVEPPDSLSVELRANIVMTPAHAKSLLYLLGAHMQEYEKQNGEIKIQWPPTQPSAVSQ